MNIKYITIVLSILFFTSATGFAQKKYTDREIGFNKEKEREFLTKIGVRNSDLEAQLIYRRLGFLEVGLQMEK